MDDATPDQPVVYACSCGKGGKVTRHGTDSVHAVLENVVGGMLRSREHEGHAIEFGVWTGTVKLDPQPRPLVWNRERPSPV